MLPSPSGPLARSLQYGWHAIKYLNPRDLADLFSCCELYGACSVKLGTFHGTEGLQAIRYACARVSAGELHRGAVA